MLDMPDHTIGECSLGIIILSFFSWLYIKITIAHYNRGSWSMVNHKQKYTVLFTSRKFVYLCFLKIILESINDSSAASIVVNTNLLPVFFVNRRLLFQIYPD